MCIWPQGRQDVKCTDFQYIQCTPKIVVDKLMSINFIILSQGSGCLMEAFSFCLPACQSIFVFDALHRQLGSSVTDNQHPASDRRKGRIHGVALSATFVTPVTSCGRRLINGLGCGSQRTSVSSHRNVQVCVCPLLNHHPHHHLHLPSPSVCPLFLYDIERGLELHRIQCRDLQSDSSWKEAKWMMFIMESAP